MTILVTGAGGNVGREVVRVLIAGEVPVRAAAAPTALPPGAEPVRLDFLDPTTFVRALTGVDGVFLMRPPAIARVGPTLNRFVDAARASSVNHVVFLSVVGADRNPVMPHHRVERHLARHGPPATLLRPSFFTQNLGDAYRRDLVEGDRLYVPAGDGRVAWVDVRDVAELAALAFADPAGHAGRGYTLTGPEAVGFEHAATLLTAALGRPIRYEPAKLRAYVGHLRRRGLSAAQIAVQTLIHANLRSGRGAGTDPALERLLGRRPRTLADYVRDHAALWSRS